jgi:hypothetical protein
MIKSSHITVFFDKKDGGPKTITSCNENFEVVKSLIKNDFFKKTFDVLLPSQEINNFNTLSYRDKFEVIKGKLKECISNENYRIYFDTHKSYQKLIGGDFTTKSFIYSAIKYFKDPKSYIDNFDHKIILDSLIEIGTIIRKVFRGTNIKIKNGLLYYNDKKIPEYEIVKHIIKSIYNNVDVSSYIKFLDNVMKNKKASIRQELFQFLENGDFRIHEDGCFSAYKKITHNWLDIFTETIDHSIGSKPRMKKEDVDDDRTRTCSTGLHFCAWEYLGSYASSRINSRIVEVKVNPKHVIAIPNDYNNMKGRCYTYEVLSEVVVNRNNVEYKGDI